LIEPLRAEVTVREPALHSAQGHAEVFGFDDHPRASGSQLGVEPVGYLVVMSLLDL
jgi:hypothetical protein